MKYYPIIHNLSNGDKGFNLVSRYNRILNCCSKKQKQITSLADKLNYIKKYKNLLEKILIRIENCKFLIEPH